MNRPMLAPATADHLLEDTSSEECHVGGTLREAAHQVRIPLRSERNVHPHAIAFAHKLILKIASHSVEHLKLEATRRDLILLRESLRFLDDRFIVRRDSRIVPFQHQLVHAANVVGIDVLLVRIRHCLRLLVGALA